MLKDEYIYIKHKHKVRVMLAVCYIHILICKLGGQILITIPVCIDGKKQYMKESTEWRNP